MARPELKPTVMVLLGLLLSGPAALADIPDEVKRALAARDYGTAVTWLRANEADPDAAFELGRLYRAGKGVAKDEAVSIEYLSRAAEAGHPEAQYVLGRHFENEGDLSQARLWIARAAAAGHQRAAAWAPRTVEAGGSLQDQIRAGRRPPSEITRADANETERSGRTVLMAAVEAGSVPWLTALLAAGADPNAADRHGTTALHRAVLSDRGQMVEMLLEAGADVRAINGQGDDALHLAVAARSTPLVRILVDAGADPAFENTAGWSAAALARRSEDPQLMSAFGIRAPNSGAGGRAIADPAVLQRRLADAALKGDLKSVDAMIDQPGFDPHWPSCTGLLIRLADSGASDVMERILNAGVKAGGQDERGRTALHAAAASGCGECVQLLVSRGAQVDVRDNQDRTPLLLAARAGSMEGLDVLIEAGADGGAVDENGRTPLWWSIRSGRVDVANRLLDREVPVTADAEGVNPLHLAAATGLVDIIVRLSAVLPVDEPTGDGHSALQLAAGSGAADSLRVLLENGAGIGFRNPLGDTALIIAARSDQLEAARVLLEAGASPSTRNERFESAASIVAERGDANWEALLAEHRQGVLGLLGSR